MKIFSSLLICFFIFSVPALAQWNPDAGYVPPYTSKAIIEASSSNGNAWKVVDSDEKTAWQSEPPFPHGFIKNPELNVLFSPSLLTKFGLNEQGNAVDGDLKTSLSVVTSMGKAAVEFSFAPTNLQAVYLKCNANDTVFIYAFNVDEKEILIAVCSPDENYNWKSYAAKVTGANKIKLVSKSKFDLFEVAAVSGSPKEFVIVDLGKIQNVGWIETRHWAGGNAMDTKLSASADKINWTILGELNPDALWKVTTRLAPPMQMRFIKVEHTLNQKDYGKVYIWEITAYDEFGPYGKIPSPKPNPHTMAELIGVNGIWGWGHDKCSDELQTGQGPTKFNQFASHARNFHNMHWDVKDPDNIPDYLSMSLGKGTDPIPWLNWNREYKAWKDAGMKVEVSVKFDQKVMPDSLWDNPYKAAYHYGFTFAQHFGPKFGNGLVDILEIGNEPWDYPASFYKETLSGMLNGAKDADTSMKVIACALQSAFPNEETKTGGNYIGVRLTEEIGNVVEALNVHHYSYAYDTEGKRRGIHPEHPESSLRAVFNDIRFRDANLPGKPIFVTEWGWDSDGAGEGCKHSECVSEKSQAVYAVRGALMFARLGIDKMIWYYYANGGNNIYGRSGLLSSSKSNFEEKKSFRAFVALVKILGNSRFLNVIQEDDEAWVYLFGNTEGVPTHIAAWKPIQGDSEAVSKIDLNGDYPSETSWKIEGISADGELDNSLASYSDGKLTLNVSAVPGIIKLKQ